MNKKIFYSVQIILPLIVLQSIHYKLFSDFRFSFTTFSSVSFYQMYVVFMAVRSVNAFLIIANHKIKRSYIQFIILTSIELLFLILTYIYKGSFFENLSDLGHISFIFKGRFIGLLLFQIFILIVAVLVLKRKECTSKHMNFFIKIFYFLFIPFIFWFTFSSSLGLRAKGMDNFKEYETNNELVGKDISTIDAFKSYHFLPSKKYLVYYMDSGCNSCIRGLANLRQFKESSKINDIIIFDVAVGTDHEKQAVISSFDLAEFSYFEGDLNLLEYVPITPALFAIDELKIKKIYIQSTPSIYELGSLFPD